MEENIPEKLYHGFERRQNPRFEFRHPIIQCRSGTRKFRSATIENISIAGLLLLSLDKYGKGDLLDIKISYVLLNQHRILSLSGKVVWIQEDSRHPGQQTRKYYSGVMFESMTYDQARNLEALINQQCCPDEGGPAA